MRSNLSSASTLSVSLARGRAFLCETALRSKAVSDRRNLQWGALSSMSGGEILRRLPLKNKAMSASGALSEQAPDDGRKEDGRWPGKVSSALWVYADAGAEAAKGGVCVLASCGRAASGLAIRGQAGLRVASAAADPA